MPDLILTLAELYDRAGGQAAVEARVGSATGVSDRVQAAKDSTEALIFSYLDKRYVRPAAAASAPDELKAMAALLWPYIALSANRNEIPEAVSEGREVVIGWLRDVAAHRAAVASLTERSTAAGTAGAGSGSSLPAARLRPHAEGALDGWLPGAR